MPRPQRRADTAAAIAGFHNADINATRARLLKGRGYADLSTVWVTPVADSVGMVPAKVVFESWMNLWTPMNQALFRLPIIGMEVGAAYNRAVQIILDTPALAKYKYMLTVEWDNLPPVDGLMKLQETIGDYGGISGLYFCKGESGCAHIWGDPTIMPKTYAPQVPRLDTIQECNAISMGFSLYKIDMFKRIPSPWFETLQDVQRGKATQDISFCQKAALHGYKFAVNTAVKVGHLDIQSGVVW